MAALQPRFRQARQDGTLEVFWPEAFQDYKTAFPDDNVKTPAYIKKKTKSGKKSLARPPGVAKPLLEVSAPSV